MATGDHAHTAVHVAQACGILDAASPVAVLSAPPRQAAQVGPLFGGPSPFGAAGPSLDSLEVCVVDGAGRRLPASPCSGAPPGTGTVAEAIRGVAEGTLQCAVTGPALRVLRDAAAAAAAPALDGRNAGLINGDDGARRKGAAPDGVAHVVAVGDAKKEAGVPAAAGWLEVVLTQ
jgi:magnesium-transporting ATPase (P-type)